MSFSFNPGGRTPGGRNADLSSEDHYLRKVVNKLDGASQSVRKAMLRSIGLESERVTRAEVIARLKVGVVDFDELVKLAGGERMPGCGAIIPVRVGFRPKARLDEPKVLNEATAARRLRLLNQLIFYLRARTGEKKNGKARQNLKRTWPGFGKALVTMSPGDSKALIDAVTAGAMTPAQFQMHLSNLSKVLRDNFRKATALGGARGLEAELCVWHLEQGCLHCHLYFRDVDVTDPKRSRLGLFGRTSKGKELSRDRLTLNSLGRSGVAMLRHKDAGHEPKLQIFEKTGLVVRDWSVLDASLAHRKSKNLGESWDVLLSRRVDRFWAEVFSTAGLKKHYENGHEAWAKAWQTDVRSQIKALLADDLKKKDEELEEQKQQTQAQRRSTALVASAQIADWRDTLCVVIRGGEPPRRFRNFFQRHSSGRLELVGGVGSAGMVVEQLDPNDPSVAVAKEFLSLARMQAVALNRYDLMDDQAEAEAFLAGEEAKWLASVPRPALSAAERHQAELQAKVEDLEAKLAAVEAEKEALVDKLAEAAPVWQSWSSQRLHEALERIAGGVARGEDEFLLDHHGYIAPQVRDRLELMRSSLVAQERTDARSALDVVALHDLHVRNRLFRDAGVEPPRDIPRPNPDDGEEWKKGSG